MAFTHYLGDCTALDGDLINEMKDHSKEITLGTLRKRCTSKIITDWGSDRGYDRHFPISRCFAISFHKSKYQGVSCYYISWSAIESVFIQPEDLQILDQIHLENSLCR